MMTGRLDSPGVSPGRGNYNSSLISGPTAKLEHVTERFASLWTDLEQEKQNKRAAEMTRTQLLHESMQRMEKSLEAEVKRRAESDKQLQSHFEGEIRALQERSALQFSEMNNSLKTAIESLTNRIQDLHTLIREERDQRRNDIEHLATSLVSKVNECVQALDEERSSRMQEQAVSLKRFGEDLLIMQSKVDTEKITRETELTQLRTEIHEALSNRNIVDEQFKSAVLDEVSNLKAALQLEREERIAEDDEIVQAVNDYTRALQDGLKLVNA